MSNSPDSHESIFTQLAREKHTRVYSFTATFNYKSFKISKSANLSERDTHSINYID